MTRTEEMLKRVAQRRRQRTKDDEDELRARAAFARADAWARDTEGAPYGGVLNTVAAEEE